MLTLKSGENEYMVILQPYFYSGSQTIIIILIIKMGAVQEGVHGCVFTNQVMGDFYHYFS